MIRRALILAAFALLLIPAAAFADADTVINFEGLTANQSITDTYASADGVTFGTPQSFGVSDNSNQCGPPQATTSTGGMNGTQSAQIACYASNSELTERYLGTAFEFSTERQKVSFDLEQTITASTTATVTFYATSGSVLNTQNVTLNQNAIAHVSYDHGTASGGVADVVIKDDVGYNVDGGVAFLDNIDATLDTTSLSREFSLALPTPSVDGVEGSTATASVSVRRFNGSTGAVTLAAGALPAGVKAVQFSPNPVNGTEPSTMTVTLASPLSGARQISITATGSGTAGTQVGTAKVQTVNADPAFTFPTGEPAIVLVPGCGSRTVTEDVNVAGNYSGGADAYIQNVFGPLSATVAPASQFIGVDGNGSYPITLDVDPGNQTGSGSLTLEVDPTNATSASETLSWGTNPVSINRTLASQVSLPVVDSGSTLDVEGNFPTDCQLTFTDEAGQTWPVVNRSIGTLADGSFIDDLTLGVPATAVSGPLTVASTATGTVFGRTTPITVNEFRIRDALSALNGGSGAKTTTFSWDDFENDFGDAEDCFIVCVPDPVALGYYLWMRSEVTSGNGLCYGYAVMAGRFAEGVQTPASYGTNSPNAWDIEPLSDSTAVKHDVVKWFTRQWDPTMTGNEKAAFNLSPAAESARLHQLLTGGGTALITIRDKSEGHAILAYAIQDNPTVNGAVVNGGERVLVYNPNRPYDPAEDGNAGLRQFNLAESAITIWPDGSWSDPSEGWTGNNATLGVQDELPPDAGSLPFSLADLVSFGAAGASTDSTVSSISSGGKSLLDSDGSPVDGSGVDLQPDQSGDGGAPAYDLTPGRSYTVGVTGTATGTYEQGLIGQGASATVANASTVSGQTDQLTVQPGQASLGFTPTAASPDLSYDLVKKLGSTSETASVALHASPHSTDQASLDGGTVSLTHDGPATAVTVTLGYVGADLPASMQTSAMTVGRGQTLQVKPTSWSNLGGGAKYVIKAKSGKVVKRGRVHLRTAGRMTLRGVSARLAKTTLTVRGSIGQPGADPLLAISAQVMNGHKVVRKASTSQVGNAVRAGRFSLPLVVGKLKRHETIKVTVLLLDQSSATPVSRRAQLTVR